VPPSGLAFAPAASVAAAAAACPDVNLLINNAGYVQHGNALDVPDLAAARREMEVNYWGVLNCCRAFAPGLIAAGGGAIVNVLSIAALASLRGVGTYSASKAAALSLSQDLRGQLAEKGVQVTAVIAGPILTDMARDAAGRHPAIAVAGAILDGVAAG